MNKFEKQVNKLEEELKILKQLNDDCRGKLEDLEDYISYNDNRIKKCENKLMKLGAK